MGGACAWQIDVAARSPSSFEPVVKSMYGCLLKLDRCVLKSLLRIPSSKAPKADRHLASKYFGVAGKLAIVFGSENFPVHINSY